MILSASLLPGRLLSTRLLGVQAPNRPAQEPGPAYVLGSPGRPSPVPTLLIVLFDDSESVVSFGGTDPLSNRYAEVRRAFQIVARRGARHELAAIVHFDTPSSGEVEPVPITRTGMLRLRAGLRPPPDGAGTSQLGPSLERATEIAEAHPEHEITLVVLSDFQLFDPDPAEVLSHLAAFPGDVHAVVLGGHLPAGVLDGRITVTQVGQDSHPGAVARALFSSLVMHRPGSQVSGAP
jgi:hypothetical protein